MRLLSFIKVIGVLVLSVCILQAQAQVLERTSPALGQVLMIYAQLTGRTILQAARLPALPESIVSNIPSDSAAAITFIEDELAKNQIDVVRDGDHFVRILPAGWEKSPVATQLAQIRPPAREAQASSTGGSPGSGEINFQNIPLEQLLEIYAQLRQRVVIRPAAPLMLPIRFRTQTSLTHDEHIYALNVLLALNGMAVIDDGDKFVQVVPIPQVPNVKLGAPKPGSDAIAIAPEQVPVFRPGPRGDPTRSGRANVDSLVAYYAELTSRRAVPTEKIGRYPVQFSTSIPLTKPELLYAIEATLALDGLVVVTGEDNSVRVGRRSAVLR